MQAIPKDITARDVNQWLQGTWFVFLHNPVAFLSLTCGSDTDTTEVIYASDGKGKKMTLTRSHCFIHWPVCGSINVPEYKIAVNVARIPAKIYCRSYNARQVEVQVPDKWQAVLYFRNQPSVAENIAGLDGNNYNVVSALFSPRYFTVEEARRLIREDGYFSVAVSSTVLVSRTDEDNTYNVHYRGKHIGELVNNRLIHHAVDPKTEMRVCKQLECVV